MDMEQHSIRLARLIAKYINQNISTKEMEELNAAVSSQELERILADFERKRERQEELLLYFEAKKEQSWENLQKTAQPKKIWKIYYKYTAAAAILLVAALSWYLLRMDMQDSLHYNEVMPDRLYGQKNDVSPGKSLTLVELANGEQVLVKDKILKIGTDDIQGDVELDQFFAQPMENIKTIITPKASNIELWLPDNTKVWLNASSTLTLDRGYNTGNRIVHLQGEAFFEVTKDAAKRFMVISKQDTVAVYGTSFNVNSYARRMETTLLEGKVRVQGRSGEKLDLPVGFQAKWRKDELRSMKVDVKKYSSWKEGYFYFHQDKLDDALRRMSDWYDIEIDTELGVEKVEISGTIDKKATLAEAASILQEVSGLKFVIDKRVLRITKK